MSKSSKRRNKARKRALKKKRVITIKCTGNISCPLCGEYTDRLYYLARDNPSEAICSICFYMCEPIEEIEITGYVTTGLEKRNNDCTV